MMDTPFATTAPTGSPFRHALLHLAAVAMIGGAAFLAFGASLRHDFVWDDRGLIVNNEWIRNTAEWPRVFVNSFWSIGRNIEEPSRSFYRPLISLSYLVDYSFHGLNPRGFHLTNLLAHIVCGILVYMLGILIFSRRLPALGAALIFTIHPSHVENVCWIAGRTDVFCAVFYLAAFFFFALWARADRPQPLIAIAGSLCYLLALLSKEMALSFPILLLAALPLLRPADRRWKGTLLPALALAAITAGYLLLRLSILGNVVGPPQYGSTAERLLTIPYVVARYAGLLFNIVRMDPHHADPLVTSLASAPFILGAGACLVLAALFGAARENGWRQPAFWMGWILITLLPVLKLGTFGDILYADRFLYLPSVGLAMLLATVIMHLRDSPHWRRSTTTAIALLLLFAAGLLISARVHSSYWRDDVTLFQHAGQTSPESAYVAFNLGNALLNRHDIQGAAMAYTRAVTLDPSYAEAFCNLGIALGRLNRRPEALACLQRARILGDHSPVLYAQMGAAFRALGDLPSAIRCYRQALVLSSSVSILNNLGECLMASGDCAAARPIFEKANKTQPSAAVLNNLGLLAMQEEQWDEAAGHLTAARALAGPPVPEDLSISIEYNLARLRHGRGDRSAAAYHATTALQLLERMDATARRNELVRELQELAGQPHQKTPGFCP